MSNNTKQIVAEVLRVLSNNDIPLDKVVLQKFIYFLNVQGFPTGFRFEPYTYGPFSFDLARTIGEMDFWDEIVENKTDIEIRDLNDIPPLAAEKKHLIAEYLLKFSDALGNFRFDTLEIAGTILFCVESLLFREKKVTKTAVVKEFQTWKGTRYSSENIENMYCRLQPFFP